jgi:hypothetical protein
MSGEVRRCWRCGHAFRPGEGSTTYEVHRTDGGHPARNCLLGSKYSIK